ncbi:hypothetical protein M2140_002165 [Clostridiales Family XIII bacterium PM5-7]
MKKTMIITLLVVICLCVVSCGANDEEDLYAERDIDSIAACLGYFDGIEVINPADTLPGALAAKEYLDGALTIYEFDPESNGYKQREHSPRNDGFILMIKHTIYDQELFDLIDRFEKIKFE